MIAERALAIAGPDARLVGRPTSDVAHVHVGPLSPSGRYVPLSGRAVCRSRTRQLTVLPERRSSLTPPEPGSRRVCARCSARLSSCSKGVNGRRAEPCTHRTDYSSRYGHLTRRDFWAQAVMAETLTELEHVAHLSLVVLGHAECDLPLPVHHEGIDGASLTELLGRLRERLADYPNRHLGEAFTALVESGYAQAKAQRQATWREREERIRRVGFVNATT